MIPIFFNTSQVLEEYKVTLERFNVHCSVTHNDINEEFIWPIKCINFCLIFAVILPPRVMYENSNLILILCYFHTVFHAYI